ncbi:hypothetical protein K438DRAFT_783364 [Mycena galopus ATCC 62051]|nr:hypothetical protein K438DRAFT_783364 [Mycena galopus ATCC 62051]
MLSSRGADTLLDQLPNTISDHRQSYPCKSLMPLHYFWNCKLPQGIVGIRAMAGIGTLLGNTAKSANYSMGHRRQLRHPMTGVCYLDHWRSSLFPVTLPGAILHETLACC